MTDEAGRPVAGARMYGIWSRAKDPHDHVPNWMMDTVHGALSNGRADPVLRSVWWRCAVSDAQGRFHIKDLPGQTQHFFAFHSHYLLQCDTRPFRMGIPTQWTAIRTYSVELEIHYPDDIAVPFTTGWMLNPDSSLGSTISDDGRLVRTRLVVDSYNSNLRNEAYGLVAVEDRFTVVESARVQRFAIEMRRLPWPRVRVMFEGAMPACAYELRWCQCKSDDRIPDQPVKSWGQMRHEPQSGLFFRHGEDQPQGRWFCGLVCGDRCLGWTLFDSNQTQTEFELVVPAPNPAQCCRVKTSRDAQGNLMAVWGGRPAIVWREDARSFLVQPARDAQPDAGPIVVSAPNLGRIALPQEWRIGGETHAEFARPACVFVEAPDALRHHQHKYGPWLVLDNRDDQALDYVPGGWGLVCQPTEIRLKVRPGKYRITWDPGGDHKPLPAVEFTVAEIEVVVLNAQGILRQRP